MRQPLTERERAEALAQFSKDTGIIISDKQQGLDTLTKYFAELLPPALLDVLRDTVDLVFTYSMEESGVTFDGRGGKAINTETGRTVTIIGEAQEAIDAGADYAVMVFTHELAHVLTGEIEHTPAYHQYLDYLLNEIEVYSGHRIKNDYFGLPQISAHQTHDSARRSNARSQRA